VTRCSPVVQSAAIGSVLGLVLGLNLGLGWLCRKVGSIAALYALHAGSFIPLTWGKISFSRGHSFTFDEVIVRVRVRLVIGLDLGFGLGLVWNSTVS